VRFGTETRLQSAAPTFPDFVREASRSLYGTALMLTGQADEAEELLQDTLARLYPKWETVAQADSPIAYVRRALINGYINERRRPRQRDLIVAEPPEAPVATDFAESVADRNTLVQLLHTLPPRPRAALVLRYIYDLPDAEIAASLDCRVATVRSLVSRGIATLHSRYQALPTGSTDAARGDHR
jgi:RNA polymerase sigma-70 factor (sigma-E family)